MADEVFEFFSLYQLFCANEEHERTVGGAEHAVDFIDPNIAVFSSFLDCQCKFQMNRNAIDRVIYSFLLYSVFKLQGVFRWCSRITKGIIMCFEECYISQTGAF